MHHMTLAEIARGLADKKFSSEELTKTLLARISQLDPQLNSFISLTEDLALQQAKAADARRANGESGALLGAPIAHKDLFCTQGIRTSCGSKMLDNFKAPYDATVVAKLAAAGTVTLGKTNMDEFAMGSGNETSYYGAAKNPWNLERVPGGSSGGSAAAVAARLLPAATGTDTGGSIRQPAALTNLTGLKPTYGRVSRWGMIAYASSLDQGGPLARTAEDCAILLQGMAGFDPQDSTSIDEPVPDYSASLNGSLQGLRIGVPKEYFSAGLDPRIAEAPAVRGSVGFPLQARVRQRDAGKRIFQPGARRIGGDQSANEHAALQRFDPRGQREAANQRRQQHDQPQHQDQRDAALGFRRRHAMRARHCVCTGSEKLVNAGASGSETTSGGHVAPSRSIIVTSTSNGSCSVASQVSSQSPRRPSWSSER